MYEEPSTRNKWSPFASALAATGLVAALAEVAGDVFEDVLGMAGI
jgi:hypothetical protein